MPSGSQSPPQGFWESLGLICLGSPPSGFYFLLCPFHFVVTQIWIKHSSFSKSRSPDSCWKRLLTKHLRMSCGDVEGWGRGKEALHDNRRKQLWNDIRHSRYSNVLGHPFQGEVPLTLRRCHSPPHSSAQVHPPTPPHPLPFSSTSTFPTDCFFVELNWPLRDIFIPFGCPWTDITL